MSQIVSDKPLTGRKVALIFIGCFATIIAANMALVWSAVGTFPGLETRKPYVESMRFEGLRDAQIALGWRSQIDYNAGRIAVALTDESGAPVRAAQVMFRVGLATSDGADHVIAADFDGRVYVAKDHLVAGNWQVVVTARSNDGTRFRRTLPLIVGGGL